jgi:uracil-DNA glycosylase family 4
MAEKKPKTKLPVIPLDHPSLDPEMQGSQKTGMACNGCDLFYKRRVTGQGAFGKVDILLLGESPSSWSVHNEQVFYGRGGRIIRQVWRELKDLDAKRGGHLKMAHLKKWETYAVQCQVEEGRDQNATATAATVHRCSHYLRAKLHNCKPKIILAFGATALRSLGYKSDKFMEARGRLLDVEIDGVVYKVLPTFSTKHLVAKTGLYNLFYADFVRAVRIAGGVDEVGANTTLEEITKEYRIPKTVEEVGELCDHIINYVVEGAKTAAQCAIAVDTETNTVNPHRRDAKLLCISFAWDTGRSCAIPLFHKEATWTPQELEAVVAHVQRVLACAKPKVFHNAKFDLKFIELRYGWRVNNVQWDSLLGEHLLREDMSGSYSLKTLGRSYFPMFGSYADKVHELAEKMTPEEVGLYSVLDGVKKGKPKKDVVGIEEGQLYLYSKKEMEQYLFGTKRERKKKVFDAGYERVPIDTLLIYAAVDTDLTRRLLRHQFARAQAENFIGSARGLMASHCIPASRALGKMEFDGFRVDRPYLDKLEVDLGKIVEDKRKLLEAYWAPTSMSRKGVEFNPNSTQHIEQVIFQTGVGPDEVTQAAYRKAVDRFAVKNKSGFYKTDKKTLKGIAEQTKCPFSKALLEYRAAHKALSGFVKDIKDLSEYDGYLHTSFHLHGTSTGRLSSSNVNMQNQPKKLAGVNIKKIFIPDDPDEEVVFNVDWKGAEIRVFTAYAPDQQLIDALNAGQDVHSWFTQEIYGIPYEEVEAKKEDTDYIVPGHGITMNMLRTTVKRVVFGILYGAMAKKIAETASISEEMAQGVIDKLFERFPSLKNYMDEVVAQIHQHGFVETLFNRRRRFPLQSVNGFFRGQAERRGKNMKIQSTSSDIVVGQLIEIFEHIRELGGRLAITVHDSIVGTIKKKLLHQAKAFFDLYCVKRVREKCPWLPVDFAYDLAVGPSYGEVISLEDYLKKNPGITQTPEQEFLELLDQDAMASFVLDEDGARPDSMFDTEDPGPEDETKEAS